MHELFPFGWSCSCDCGVFVRGHEFVVTHFDRLSWPTEMVENFGYKSVGLSGQPAAVLIAAAANQARMVHVCARPDDHLRRAAVGACAILHNHQTKRRRAWC